MLSALQFSQNLVLFCTEGCAALTPTIRAETTLDHVDDVMSTYGVRLTQGGEGKELARAGGKRVEKTSKSFMDHVRSMQVLTQQPQWRDHKTGKAYLEITTKTGQKITARTSDGNIYTYIKCSLCHGKLYKTGPTNYGKMNAVRKHHQKIHAKPVPKKSSGMTPAFKAAMLIAGKASREHREGENATKDQNAFLTWS